MVIVVSLLYNIIIELRSRCIHLLLLYSKDNNGVMLNMEHIEYIQ